MPDLTEARRLEAAATRGPWSVEEFDLYLSGPDGDPVHWDAEGLGATWRADADPKLLVHLRNHATDYFDAVEQRDQLREALEHALELAEEYHSGHSVAGAPCKCQQCRELRVVRRYAREALRRQQGEAAR